MKVGCFAFVDPFSVLERQLERISGLGFRYADAELRGEVRALHERLRATLGLCHARSRSRRSPWLITSSFSVPAASNSKVGQLDLYDRPANRFIAGFMGSPAMNFLASDVSSDGTQITWTGLEHPVSLGRCIPPSRPAQVGPRPEHLRLEPDDPISATVLAIEATGSWTYVHAEEGGQQIALLEYGRSSLRRGDRIRLETSPQNIHFFDPKIGVAL